MRIVVSNRYDPAGVDQSYTSDELSMLLHLGSRNANGKGSCSASTPGSSNGYRVTWRCTRKHHTDGVHIASNGINEVLATWTDTSELVVIEV